MLNNMLTIHSINPTGMFSYGMCDTVYLLNKGLIHLLGVNEDKVNDSNGSGKSSLFNAICELLFQENPTREKGDSVINSLWNKGFAGRIVFTNYEGKNYRITYCRKWKEALYPADNDTKTQYVGTNLFLDFYEDGVWVDCRGTGMPDTHLKIGQIIGMTYNQFLSISYMSNRAGDQFLKGTNKDRMDLLSSISGIEEWDHILEECRSSKRSLSLKTEDVDKKVFFEKGAIQTLQEQLQGAKSFDWDFYLKGLHEQLEECKSAWKKENWNVKKFEQDLASLKDAQDGSVKILKVSTIKKEIDELNTKLKKHERSLSATSYIEEDPALHLELADTATELNQAKGILSTYMGKSGVILDADKCPTCLTIISKEQKDKILAKVNDLSVRIKEIENKKSKIERKIEEDLSNKKKANESKKLELQKFVENLRAEVSKKHEQLQVEQQLYRSFEPKLEECRDSLKNAQTVCQGFIHQGNSIKSQIESAKTSMKNIQEIEVQIEEKKSIISLYEGQIQDVKKDLDIYVWLIDNIPFIKLHKMSNFMAEVSNLCNKYFSEMGESLRISITSFEEKAKKKHAADVKDLLKSEIKVEITDGAKNIPPKLYSDGELSKISLSIIRALHEIARSKGHGCNLMMMDEIFGFVDPGNSQKIAESMTNLLSRGTVFVTDNSGRAKDLVKFDHTWIARKKIGQTFLEVD